MTDITELAQRMKAAAIDAKELGNIARYSKGYEAIKAFSALMTPDNVLALVEALEAKGKQIDILRQDKDTVIDTSLERINKILSRADAAEKRIAELEARTVKLSKRSVGEVMHMSGFSRDYAEGWCSGNDNAIHEVKQAGVAVEGDTNANNN